MQKLLWIKRIRFALGCILVLAAISMGFLLFEMIRNSGDLVDVDGSRLRMHMGRDWPADLSQTEISSGSVTSYYSIDSHTTFLCLEASQEVAAKWRNHFDRDHVLAEKRDGKPVYSKIETRKGRRPSIPLKGLSGKLPDWWRPPEGECDSYETIGWYADSESGVGQGNYVQYDSERQRVWILVNSCQHHLIWDKGNPQ